MPALFCLIMFIVGLFKQNVGYLTVSSIFAIAYAIERCARSKNEDD